MKVVLNRVLAALPFIVLIGIFNPVFDRAPVELWDGHQIRAGWISFFSIILRGVLCVSAAVTLIGTTSFPRFIAALQALKVPDALATQLMLIYRYLFLMLGQARSMRRAKSLRSASEKTRFRVAISMLAALLNRTLDLAQSVWMAMKARGFDGRLKVTRPMIWRRADSLYLALVLAGSVLFRFWPVSEWLGRMIEAI
jgi:cobalt/nickel transport system permease protein